MLKVIAKHDSALRAQLGKPRQGDATYIPPRIQNEIIDIIGNKIKRSIVEEVKQARFYFIMLDEVTSHNHELMPLCIRFVDAHKDVREEFIQFSALPRVTGEAIASQVCSDLRNVGLEIKNIRGQGYNGASNMASERLGVQAIIKRESPLALYSHCSGHCLNLVISHSCSIPIIRSVLDKMKATCLFFLNSPKRNGLPSEVVASNVVEMSRRHPLIDVCMTCWAERHSAYQHFYQCYKFIVITSETIALGFYQNDLRYNLAGANWSSDCKSNANLLLHAVTSFEFVIAILMVRYYCSSLNGLIWLIKCV